MTEGQPPQSPQSQPPQSPPPQSPPPQSQPAATQHQAPAGGGQGTNGMAVASLVLGIAGVLFAIFIFPVGLILGVLGLIFAIIGRNKAAQLGGRGMAMAGLITSIIALLIAAIWIVVTVLLVNEAGQALQDVTIETSP